MNVIKKLLGWTELPTEEERKLQKDLKEYSEAKERTYTLYLQGKHKVDEFNTNAYEAAKERKLPSFFEKRGRSHFFVFESITFNARDIKTFYLLDKGNGKSVFHYEGRAPAMIPPFLKDTSKRAPGTDPKVVDNVPVPGTIQLVYHGGSLNISVDPFWIERFYEELIEQWKKIYE